ncbi:hypothetical protein CEP51_004590 [Fusarium floridanum]|uniref:Glucuronyl hydrolase n=1 Tax=Fusarium floridanum TaxID=1325733 RepID=A0A428S0Q0_9HYPO|nr:hypothetical protein CEP51_004590 [Fusarium floridanum]
MTPSATTTNLASPVNTKKIDDVARKPPKDVTETVLSNLYVERAWKLASKVLTRQDAPDLFPHFTFPGLSYYTWNDSTFWTSGFFPGIVWLLYERSLMTPLSVAPSKDLLLAAQKWQVEMAKEQFKTDNHDLGFMIMPSFSRDYDLTGNRASLDVVVNAARSLASRFSPTTGTIRSWAGARTKLYSLDDPDVDFVVVIDSMMNLDLLYYAAHHTGDKSLADIATAHATTTLANHIRPNYSSYHLVSYDPNRQGVVRHRLTNQGYANESTWARGQAWALYGFAAVYQWTKDEKFLDAAIEIANYFLSRVDESNGVDTIVYWDFDAPRPGVWDVSAAACASSGLLLLQQLAPDRCNYLESVLRILDTVTARATSKGDCLLERSTSNDHEHALHRLTEHGVVYADYYFLEAGNRLLQLQGKQRNISHKDGRS